MLTSDDALFPPFLLAYLSFWGFQYSQKVTPSTPPLSLSLSLIGRLCIQGSILFPSEVEKGGEVPGLASEIIIVSIPPPFALLRPGCYSRSPAVGSPA